MVAYFFNKDDGTPADKLYVLTNPYLRSLIRSFDFGDKPIFSLCRNFDGLHQLISFKVAPRWKGLL